MRSTVWLDEEEIKELLNILPSYSDTANSDIADGIMKELGVAEARAESSRILSHNYKHVIGKDSNQIPVRLDSIEKLFLLTIITSSSLKEKIS